MFVQVCYADDVRRLCAEKDFETEVRWELHAEISEEEIRRIFFLYPNVPDREGLWVALAEWYGTPADILNELSKTKSRAVHRAVALHTKCPVEDLTRLSQSDDAVTAKHAEWTLGRVALMRTNLPSLMFWDLYRKSCGSESHQIALRYEMIKHPNLPIQLLEQLAKDSSSQVRGPAEMRLRSVLR